MSIIARAGYPVIGTIAIIAAVFMLHLFIHRRLCARLFSASWVDLAFFSFSFHCIFFATRSASYPQPPNFCCRLPMAPLSISLKSMSRCISKHGLNG